MVISRLHPALLWSRKHLLFRMSFGWCCSLPLPPLPANLCSLTEDMAQPQSLRLCVEAVVSGAVTGTVSPMTRVGPALWVLHEMFFPAHAVAEPEESPFPLHFKPDGDYSLPSAQFAMPSAKSCSHCRKTITVLRAHIWHLQRSHAALTSHKSFQACTSSTCRNPLQGRNAPLFWFLLQHG